MTDGTEKPDNRTRKKVQEIEASRPRPPGDDISVRATDIGSLLPEATYRAVPIVWFVSAMMLQFLALAFLLSLPTTGIATVALATLASLIVRYWTFRRGMSRGSRAWRVATDVCLLLNWGWLSAIAMLR